MKIKEDLLYQYSERVAKVYSKFYTQDFKYKGYELEDIKQEFKLVAFELMNKYKNKSYGELKKIFSQAAVWKINILRRNNVSHTDNLSAIVPFDEEYHVSENYKILGDEPEILFSILEKECDSFEYSIIIKKFKENKTNTEIAKELQVSKQYIAKVLKNLLEYLKTKLNLKI